MGVRSKKKREAERAKKIGFIGREVEKGGGEPYLVKKEN